MSTTSKVENYDLQKTDLILIMADKLSRRYKGLRIHSTNKYYWEQIWQFRERQLLGVIRNGLFIYVDQLTK